MVTRPSVIADPPRCSSKACRFWRAKRYRIIRCTAARKARPAISIFPSNPSSTPSKRPKAKRSWTPGWTFICPAWNRWRRISKTASPWARVKKSVCGTTPSRHADLTFCGAFCLRASRRNWRGRPTFARPRTSCTSCATIPWQRSERSPMAAPKCCANTIPAASATKNTRKLRPIWPRRRRRPITWKQVSFRAINRT